MNTTHYLLILDRSGSMYDCWDSTMSALNEQIQSIRTVQERNTEVPIKVNFLTFNDDVHFEFLNVPAAHLEPLNTQRLFPSGCTAMLDGIGQGIQRIQHVMHPDDDVVCIILTDGEENASKEYNFGQIGKMIESLKSNGKWSFVLMGADFDIFDMARKLKIDAEKQMRYQKTQTNAVFKEVNLMMNDYIVAKQAGRFKDSFNFDKKNNKKKND
jgi:hypothetical protein